MTDRKKTINLGNDTKKINRKPEVMCMIQKKAKPKLRIERET